MLSGPIKGQKVQLGGREEGGKEGGDGQIKARSTEIALASDSRTTSETEIVAAAYPAT